MSFLNCSISWVFDNSFQLWRPKQRTMAITATTLRIMFLFGFTSRDRLNPCSRSECERLRFCEKFRKDLVSSFAGASLINFCFIFTALLSSPDSGVDVIAEIEFSARELVCLVSSTRIRFTRLYASSRFDRTTYGKYSSFLHWFYDMTRVHPLVRTRCCCEFFSSTFNCKEFVFFYWKSAI